MFVSVQEHIVKKLEQVQVVMGTAGLSHTDSRWFAAQLFNTILGGSVSSRLFQTVREDLGLTYSIGSGLTCFHDCGLFQITAATNPQQLDALRTAIETLLQQVRTNGVDEDELQRAKEQVVSSLLMSLESSLGRMNRAAKMELYGLPLWSAEAFVAEIEATSLAQVNAAAQALLAQPFSCLSLGPRLKKGKKQ